MQSTSSTATTTSIKMLLWVLVGMGFIALLLFAFIDPVAAKGPESLTITGPGIDRPLELIDSTAGTIPDPILRLMEQTGLWYGPMPVEEPAGELGPAYTLTWINSGPPEKSVEQRTYRQRIYLDAENGPLIHTPAQESLSGWGPGVIGWFEAPDGLRDTLAELGVPLSPAPSSRDGAFAETSVGSLLPDRGSAGALWYVGLAGLVFIVGLAGALGVRRATR